MMKSMSTFGGGVQSLIRVGGIVGPGDGATLGANVGVSVVRTSVQIWPTRVEVTLAVKLVATDINVVSHGIFKGEIIRGKVSE
jgi:hypothetical protein